MREIIKEGGHFDGAEVQFTRRGKLNNRIDAAPNYLPRYV